jgi:hypothetical protein
MFLTFNYIELILNKKLINNYVNKLNIFSMLLKTQIITYEMIIL